MFSWNQLNYPLVLCPPMDGITDLAYRELVAEMGGADALYCEFINVKGLIHENPKTLFELTYTENQRPIIAQLFGNDPEDFYVAAKMAVNLGFDGIDINMGCPAPKVASKGGGCALMGNTENAKKIVEMTIKGANEAYRELKVKSGELKVGETCEEYEVTCKMRLGIDDITTVQSHAAAMIEAGAKAVAIHGRTLRQLYTGQANWEPAKQFNDSLIQQFDNFSDKPKVFGSGDVKSLYDAFEKLITTGVDGVMIGRGSFGNPWVFDKKKVLRMKELVNQFRAEGITDLNQIPNLEEIKEELANHKPTFEESKITAIHHAELILADKGEKGFVQVRKHLAWYFQGFDGAKELRNQLVRVNSVEEIKNILNNFELTNLELDKSHSVNLARTV